MLINEYNKDESKAKKKQEMIEIFNQRQKTRKQEALEAQEKI